ncbi:MAG TPA: M2 family metallopeptidase [Acidimicrobiia bacterium]|nr:M2 family metallopeptidase [Acidimicrobiia bacterium]
MRTADALVAELEAQLRPLEIELAEAWWASNTEASPDADARRTRAELARREYLADAAVFAELRAARATPPADPLLARQLDLLHDAFVPHQVPAALRQAIVELETRVESTFNTFRGTIDGRRVDDNEIAEILRTSSDVSERRAAWEAAKAIGPEVADQVRELARLRNEAARSLGYRDHFALALATSELDEERLFTTLDEVDRATAAPFATWKGEVDQALAARFGVEITQLRPWHLDDPFFQSPPADGAVTLDHLFSDADLERLTLRTYDGLGLDVRAVLSRSDLFARDGKSQHAFCIDIDREGDVRVLCNVEPSERWMDTMLHEFGHAIYDRECDRSLPWLLRGASHALTTEGVAMLMGRLPRDPEWLLRVAEIDAPTAEQLRADLAAAQRAALLVFARWVLVMTTFERALYADPDADLDTLWWDLVERHQLVTRPDDRHAPDWAAKIHLAVAPVYYQNYLYGELFASQLHATLVERVGGMVDAEPAGELMVREVFAPGASKRWDQLVTDATGAPLSATAFAQQLSA